MKKQLVLIVALVFAATTWTQAQTVLDFKLVNKTGNTFFAVYLTDTNTEDWGEDILPDAMVEDGDVIDITFDYTDDETICTWDLKLTEDASEETWVYLNELDLCEAKIVTIYIDEDGEYAFEIE
jgi:hypothetical protein